MKLLYCETCHSVFNIRKHIKQCECGKSGGYYLDDGLNARYWGTCFPLGFANGDFNYAIANQPEYPRGRKFTAFVIERNCPTMEKVGIDTVQF